jgi:diguanylate cyclase (GGDEF)-like protein/PAS domain S-box-containing protein
LFGIGRFVAGYLYGAVVFYFSACQSKNGSPEKSASISARRRGDASRFLRRLFMAAPLSPQSSNSHSTAEFDAIAQHNATAQPGAEEVQYQSVVDNVPCMVYRFVMHPDGSFEFPLVSEGCRDIYGVERQQIQQNPTVIIDMIVPEDRASFNDSVAESAHTLTGWLWEGRVITGPGDYKWVHGDSRPRLQESGDIVWDGVLMNITSRKEAELLQRASEERFTAFMNNSPAIAFMKDEAGHYVYVNRPFEQRFDLTREQWFSKTDHDLWPEIADGLRQHDEQVLSSGATVEIEDAVPAPDGSMRHWRGFKFAVTDAAGHSLVAAMMIDVTDQKRIAQALQEQQAKLQVANAQLELLASKDGLTGVNNYRAFQARLEEMFNQSARYQTPLSVVLLDVDHFKAYNDDFGHPAGDEVLKRVAECLQRSTRNTDFVARYGGEEFVIILTCTEAQNSLPVCERIRLAIAQCERMRLSIEEEPVVHRQVTASFGVASYSPEINTLGDFIAAADKALYHSKKSGRNRVTHAMHMRQGLPG